MNALYGYVWWYLRRIGYDVEVQPGKEFRVEAGNMVFSDPEDAISWLAREKLV